MRERERDGGREREMEGERETERELIKAGRKGEIKTRVQNCLNCGIIFTPGLISSENVFVAISTCQSFFTSSQLPFGGALVKMFHNVFVYECVSLSGN